MPSHKRVSQPIDKRKALALAVGMDMGKEMVAYLERMYPDVFEKMNSGCRLSIRNHIANDFVAAMEIAGAKNHLERLKVRAKERRDLLVMVRVFRRLQKKAMKDGK